MSRDAQKRYEATPKGREARARAQARYRAKAQLNTNAARSKRAAAEIAANAARTMQIVNIGGTVDHVAPRREAIDGYETLCGRSIQRRRHRRDEAALCKQCLRHLPVGWSP